MLGYIDTITASWLNRSRVSTGIFNKKLRILANGKLISCNGSGLVVNVRDNVLEIISDGKEYQIDLQSVKAARYLSRKIFNALRPFYVRCIKWVFLAFFLSLLFSMIKVPASNQVNFIPPAVSTEDEMAQVMKLIEQAKHNEAHGHSMPGEIGPQGGTDMPPIPFSD